MRRICFLLTSLCSSSLRVQTRSAANGNETQANLSLTVPNVENVEDVRRRPVADFSLLVASLWTLQPRLPSELMRRSGRRLHSRKPRGRITRLAAPATQENRWNIDTFQAREFPDEDRAYRLDLSEKAYEMARVNTQLTTGPLARRSTEVSSLGEISRKIDESESRDRDEAYYEQLDDLHRIRKINDKVYCTKAFPESDDRLAIETIPSIDSYRLQPEGTLDGNLRQKGPDGTRFVARISDMTEPKSLYLQRLDKLLRDDDLLVRIDGLMNELQNVDDGNLPQDHEEVLRAQFIKLGLHRYGGNFLMNLCLQLAKRRRLGESDLDAVKLWLRVVSRTDELYQVAEQLQDSFELVVLELTSKVGLDLSNFIRVPLKDPVRIYEKAMDDYNGVEKNLGDGVIPEAWVSDVLRCTIVVEDASQLIALQALLSDKDWQPLSGEETDVKLQHVRAKNMFAQPVPTHYRFILNNIILSRGALSMMCEIQISQKWIFEWDGKLESHHRYNFFRAFLRRSGEIDNIEREIEERIIQYDEMLDTWLWKFGMDYQQPEQIDLEKLDFFPDQKQKLVVSSSTRTPEETVRALEPSIRRIFDKDPPWDLFSNSLTLVDDVGIKLEGLRSFKKFYAFFHNLTQHISIKADAKIFGVVHLNRFQIQWDAELRLKNKHESPLAFHMKPNVRIQAITAIEFDDQSRVHMMYLTEWRVNGRSFPLWPDIDLSDDFAENLETVKKWIEDINKLLSLSPSEQELLAAKYERARRKQPFQCAEIAESGVDRKIHVVEFGSLNTYANLVKLSADGSASLEAVEEWKGPALETILRDLENCHCHCELCEELIDKIADAIPCGRILAIGADGLRFALETNRISQQRLDYFADMFSKRLGSRARFDILTVEEEAQAEWLNVEYALRSMDNMQGRGIPSWADVSGMISAKGISCQLAMRSDRSNSVSFASFKILLVPMTKWLTSRDHTPGTPWLKAFRRSYEDRLRKNIAETNVRGLKGVYILTELWQVLSHKSFEGPGIDPYRTFSVSDVKAALVAWLEKPTSSASPLSKSQAIAFLMATAAVVVFDEMFDLSARVCFMGGGDMHWMIGWALQQEVKEKEIGSYIDHMALERAPA